MKILHLLLILLLASEYKLCSGENIGSASYCNSQSGSGFYRCCFEKIECDDGSTFTYCVGIDKTYYDQIKIFEEARIKIYERRFKVDDYEIDCSSRYFYTSAIYIVITLLFLC